MRTLRARPPLVLQKAGTENAMKNRLKICAAKQGAFSAARGLAAASLLFVALVAVPPATGLTASGNAAPPSVRTTPDHSTLTPAAPVPSKVLPSSEEDIRDIRQPRHVPSPWPDRKSTRLNSSHANISYAVFCLKKKK